MKRIGYDSDSGRHYFRDSDGSYWKGAPGEEFGEMTKGELSALAFFLTRAGSPC